jgi:hypothetical protein
VDLGAGLWSNRSKKRKKEMADSYSQFGKVKQIGGQQIIIKNE